MAAAPALAGNDTDAQRMSHSLQDAWLAFARSNDPSSAALGRWPSYRPGTRLSLVIDAEPHVAADWGAESLRRWERVYRALR